QLNHDLANLGYAARADITADGWDYYSWETAQAVQQLEEHLGVVGPPGSLSLGQVVFEPRAIRVSHVTGTLGGPASADGDLRPARGDDPAGRLRPVAGESRGQSDRHAAGRDDRTGPDLLGRRGSDYHGRAAGAGPDHHDPGAGEAGRSGGGGDPGPGAGDGEHHHRQRQEHAGGAGVGAAGPVAARVRRRGGWPGEQAALGSGAARDLRWRVR